MTRIFIALFAFFPLAALALVDINSASIEELDTLPGVGPAIAEKIIAGRPFSSVTEIENVQGIGGPGSKTYDGLINLITVSGGSSDAMGTSDSESSADTVERSSASGKTEIREPVSGLTVSVPEIGFTNQLIKFSAGPEDGDKDRLIRYRWNFGDGQIAEGSSVGHMYKHPGNYLVVVESYYLKETKLAKVEIKILSPDLSIQAVGLTVTLKNQSPYDMDLSGMSLSDQDWNFVFPEHSWLIAGQSLSLERNTNGGEVYLYDEAGGMVIFKTPVLANARPTATPRISAVNTVSSKVIDESPTVVGDDGRVGGGGVSPPPTRPRLVTQRYHYRSGLTRDYCL